MLQTVPAYAGGLSHPVELDRQVLLDQYRRTGLTHYNGFSMTSVGGSMALNVGPGAAFLKGDETAQQGGYFVWSDAGENIPWPAASGQPRIDMLVLRVVDTQYGSDPGNSRAEWDIVQGTPAASPTAPSTSLLQFGNANYKPGAYYVRAYVRVDNGDTDLVGNTITAANAYAAGARRLWLAPDAASLPSNSFALKGDLGYVTSTEREYKLLDTGIWYPESSLSSVKTADTLRNNTTALVNDMGVTLGANERWKFRATLFYKYNSTAKFRVAMGFPADAECVWGVLGLDTSVTGSAAGVLFGGAFENAVSGTAFGLGGANSGQFLAIIEGTIFMGATAGNLQVQHGPDVSNVNTVGLYKGSMLEATPLKPY